MPPFERDEHLQSRFHALSSACFILEVSIMIGALLSIVILMAIALLHCYWAMGGSWGKSAAIPSRDGKPLLDPTPYSTFFIAICLTAAAGVIAMRAGLAPSAALGSAPYFMTWVLVMIFAIRAIGDFNYVGFFKRVKGTPFARLDTAFYSPLCVLLAILIADAARL